MHGKQWRIRYGAMVLLACSAMAFAAPLKLENWTTLEPDKTVQHKGNPALAWPDPVKNTVAKAQDVPADLSAYKVLSFRAHVAEPKKSHITLVFASENPETKGIDYYSTRFSTDFQGWRRFQISLPGIGASRKPLGWDQIGSVYWSSNWAHDLDPTLQVHFADIELSDQPIPGMEKTAGEMLDNRSFELGPPGGTPAGWGINAFKTDSTAAIDDREAHSGAQSVRIDGKSGKGRAGLTKGFRSEMVNPAYLYRFTAWVKLAQESKHSQRTSIRFTSVKGKSDVLKSQYLKCDPGPHDWKRYQWDVRLAPGAEWFNIVLFHHGEGTAWWDDVSLVAIRTVDAVSPQNGALIENGKPVFEWAEPLKGTLEIAADGDFDGKDVKRIPVNGTRHALAQPLPTGRFYSWRVVAETDKGLAVTAPAGKQEDENATARFYVGSQEQMKEDIMEKYADLQDMYERLKTFAERNEMWAAFPLLGNFLKEAGELTTPGVDNFATRKAKHDDTWSELQYTMPWWNKIFLDEKAFYNDLNLDYPGLEKVKAAVNKGDYEKARKALHAYYVARRKPNYYNKYLTPPRRSPMIKNNARADQYLTHEMPIHSYKTPTYDLGRDFNWHVFPIIDVEWPTKIHRHFHWSRLAAAYRQTGNEKYAEEIVQQLFDWCMDNPMERWDRHRYRWAWSTLNATVRLYSSWINSWYQIRESEAWDPDAQYIFLNGLREHGRFLMTHAARTGNWVVAEAQGLVELGIMFPEFKEAETWRSDGYNRLLKEIQTQVFDDGVQQERTPGYHGMTINCFMKPVQLGILNEIDFKGRDTFIAKLEKMHEYYLYMANPQGRTAQVGDGHQSNVRGRLQSGYQMFRRLDMQFVATQGKEGKPPVYRSYAFHNAGQYINRSVWVDPNALWAFLDWGGDGGFHCHDDMGQLSISAYGQFLLIDTGIFAYAKPPRTYFMETTGHNTVLVDNTTQKRRDPIEAKWISTESFDVFRGLTDNSEPLLHERTVAFRQPGELGPGYWLVVDRMSGGDGKSHRMDQRWNPTENLKGEVRGDQAIYTGKGERKDEQPSLVVANLSQPGLKSEIIEGFISYKWYKKIPVDLARFTFEATTPQTFVTVLYPTPPGAPPATIEMQPVVATLNGKAPSKKEVSAVRVIVQDGKRRFEDTWAINHTGSGSVVAGDIGTDGRVAMVRREGDAMEWLATEATQLLLGGKTLFSATAKVDGSGAVPLQGKTAFYTTGGEGIRFAASGVSTVNGAAAKTPGSDGLVNAGKVAAPEIPSAPREPGGVRFEIGPPADPLDPNSTAKMLDEGFTLPDSAVKALAGKYSGQGGGAVQVTTTKAGSDGLAFLHWDSAGHWLEYTIDAPSAGDYRLYLKACSAEVSVVRKVSIDGESPKPLAAVEILGTGGFSNNRNDWRAFEMTDTDGKPLAIELKKGENVVRLENIDGMSLNLDWIAVAPVK